MRESRFTYLVLGLMAACDISCGEFKHFTGCASTGSRWELPVSIDGAGSSVQAFMGSAGDDGVLYVAMGTIATLGEAPACRTCTLHTWQANAYQPLFLCGPQSWAVNTISVQHVCDLRDCDTAPA